MSNNSGSPSRQARKDLDRRLSLSKSHITRALADLQKRPSSPKSLTTSTCTTQINSTESPPSSRCSSNGANSPVSDDLSTAGVESITVLVRTRPLNEQEKADGDCLRIEQPSCLVTLKPLSTAAYRPGTGPYTFRFDHALEGDCPQEEVFETVGREACDHFLDGFNVAIFAYGQWNFEQTGAGKTFTMYGELKGPGSQCVELSQRAGLVPRSLAHIFQAVQGLRARCSKVNFCVSLIEIYNESVMDLLCNDGRLLNVREDALRDRTFVDGALAQEVFTVEQCMELLHKGAMNRTTGATAMNKESSRSHSVFTLSLDVEETDSDTSAIVLRQSQFHLIDLAGSERQKHSKAVGRHLREAGSINRSLTVLGKVIMALAEGSRHVPYRDSKLTFLLKNSIGGNSKTYMIANVSPSNKCFDETLSTLKFASFAKKPLKHVTRNVTTDVTIDDLKKEIRRLKQELSEGRIQPSQARRRSMQPNLDDTEEMEWLWREAMEREAGLRAKLVEERQHFRARLEEYDHLCHSLEQCLQSSKIIIKLKDQKLRDALQPRSAPLSSPHPPLHVQSPFRPPHIPLGSVPVLSLSTTRMTPSQLQPSSNTDVPAVQPNIQSQAAPAAPARLPSSDMVTANSAPERESDVRRSEETLAGAKSWMDRAGDREHGLVTELELAKLRIRRLEEELAQMRESQRPSPEPDAMLSREESIGDDLDARLQEAYLKLEEERRAHISALDLLLEARESEERAKLKLQETVGEIERMTEERCEMERQLEDMGRLLVNKGCLREVWEEEEEAGDEEPKSEADLMLSESGLHESPAACFSTRPESAGLAPGFGQVEIERLQHELQRVSFERDNLLLELTKAREKVGSEVAQSIGPMRLQDFGMHRNPDADWVAASQQSDSGERSSEMASLDQARFVAEQDLELARRELILAKEEMARESAARAKAEQIQQNLIREIEVLRDAEEEWIHALQEAQARADILQSGQRK